MTADGPPFRWTRSWTCYGLLAGILLYTAVERFRRPLEAPDGTTPSIPAHDVQSRVDPETASWAELARLPDVGESLARQIVAYRERRRAELHGAPGNRKPVFTSIADLDPVPGLGPKRLQRMAPLLIFPSGGGPPETDTRPSMSDSRPFDG